MHGLWTRGDPTAAASPPVLHQKARCDVLLAVLAAEALQFDRNRMRRRSKAHSRCGQVFRPLASENEKADARPLDARRSELQPAPRYFIKRPGAMYYSQSWPRKHCNSTGRGGQKPATGGEAFRPLASKNEEADARPLDLRRSELQPAPRYFIERPALGAMYYSQSWPQKLCNSTGGGGQKPTAGGEAFRPLASENEEADARPLDLRRSELQPAPRYFIKRPGAMYYSQSWPRKLCNSNGGGHKRQVGRC
jgi:hypothetical protein